MKFKGLLVFLFCIGIGYSSETKLSYNELWKMVLYNSVDIKIASENIAVSAFNVKQSEADMFPSVTLQSYSEFSDDLAADSGDVISIGGTTIGDDTKAQSSLSIKTQTPLFTYGKEYADYLMVKYDYYDKIIQYYNSIEQIELDFLDLFQNYWLTDLNVQRDEELTGLSLELSKVTNKLYDAGKVSLIEVIDNDYLNKQYKLSLKQNKSQRKKYLKQLSYYTGNFLGKNSIKYNYYKNKDVTQSPDYYQSISYITFKNKKDSLITQRNQAEAEGLPSFYLYSQMSYYGTDKNSIDKSLKNMNESNFSFGVQGQMSFFDGFESLYKFEKIKKQLALVDMEIQNDKKEYEFALNEVKDDAEVLKDEIEFLDELKQSIVSKRKVMQKMDDQRLVSKDKLLESQIKEIEISYQQQSTIAKLWVNNRKYAILAKQHNMEKLFNDKYYLINRMNDFKAPESE